MAFIDTPRTDVEGNLTFLDGKADAINDMSMEASFLEPKKPAHSLVEQMRKKRNPSALRTPSARAALNELSNRKQSTNRRSGEFTPLMQSVTKRNASKAAAAAQETPMNKENYNRPDQMPEFLKDDLNRDITPLSKPEFSFMSHSSSIAPSEKSFARPPDSSGYSSPMNFPERGDGVLGNGRNIMNLKEQERLVDKIEKENFGLKLKIHFLEQRLAERDPNYNETAIKENGQLKMDRVVMQKELSKIKKQLARAEKEAEALRLELKDAQAHAEREEELQRLEDEVNRLHEALDQKDAELERKHSDKEDELQKVEEECDLLRQFVDERDGAIDDKDSEIERLKKEAEELKAAAEANGDDTTEMRDSTEANEAKLTALSDEITDLKEAANAKDDEIEDLKASNNALEYELDELKETRNSKDDELADLKDECHSKDERLEDLQELCEGKDQELLKIKELCQSKDDELVDLRHIYSAKDTQLAELQAALQTSGNVRMEKLNKLAEEVAELNRICSAKDHELAQLQSELNATESRQRSKLADELAGLNRACSAKDRELAQLQSELDAAGRREQSKIADEVADLNQVCSVKDRELAELQSKLDAAERRLRKTVADDVADLNRACSNKDREIARLQSELGTSESRQRKKLDQLSDELANLDARYHSKEKELSAVRAAQAGSVETQSMKIDEMAKQIASLELACGSKDDEIKQLKRKAKSPAKSPVQSKLADYERADYERAIQDANLEIDDLKDKWTRTKQFVDQATTREQELCEKVRRVRQERNEASEKADAAQRELLGMQRRFDEKVDEFQSKQSSWDREKARVRFVNTSMTSEEQNEKLEQLQRKHSGKVDQLVKKHSDKCQQIERKHSDSYQQLEKKHETKHQQLGAKYKDSMDMLAREIKWLRAKAEREEGFRAALIHEKTYLTRSTEEYQKHNLQDLRILRGMGARSRQKVESGRGARSKFAAAIHAVRFTIRLQRLAGQWAKTKDLRPLRTSATSRAKAAPSRAVSSHRELSNPALNGKRKASIRFG